VQQRNDPQRLNRGITAPRAAAAIAPPRSRRSAPGAGPAPSVRRGRAGRSTPGRAPAAFFPLLALALSTVFGLPARADGYSYPRAAAHVHGVSRMSSAQKDTLARFDVVSCREDPQTIAEMRARNPEQRLFYRHMPQFIVRWTEDETYWYADTSYSLARLCQYYAMQNDWYLYDIFGEPIEEWGCYAANWTPYCPEGTYGTSVGMTYAEWYINVALPQIAFESTAAWGEAWGWGSSAYDGIAWEVMYECPACCAYDRYRYADPDRDGEIEGIAGSCWDGGDDSLAVLVHETNLEFWEDCEARIPPSLIINTNRGTTPTQACFAYNTNGLKLEDWKPNRYQAHSTWWSWMYGRRDGQGELIGDGYAFAEQRMHRSGDDRRDGWDVTWLVVATRGAQWDPAYAARMRRWGLGTTLLGDGTFIFTHEYKDPIWCDELNIEFGGALEDYQRELVGSDTLYVRRFEKGFVEVNPYAHTVAGIHYEDARFSYWLTLDDLSVTEAGSEDVFLNWEVPASDLNEVESFEVRYATFPITAENWESAVPGAIGPAAGDPGETIEYAVRDLEPEQTYYFAVRNQVRGRVDPQLSNVVSVTLDGSSPPPPPPPPDTTPPAAIADLAAAGTGSSWIDFSWTAVGDDGVNGTADAYRLRYRPGAAIEDEADWNEATPAQGLPVPAPSGSPESYRLDGLDPETAYGVALRAVDEAGNVGALSPPLLVTTGEAGAEADTLAPDAPAELKLVAIGETWASLRWRSPGDDGAEGIAARFALGYRDDGPLASEADWAAADTLAAGLPEPGTPGTWVAFTLEPLTPGTDYNLNVRAYDEAGNASPLAAPLAVATIAALDEDPPGAIDDLLSPVQGPDAITLSWSAPGDDGAAGTATRYLLRYRLGAPISNEFAWQAADSVPLAMPAPEPAGTPQTVTVTGLAADTDYGFALRAVDEADNLAPLSNPLVATTTPPPDTLAPETIADLAVAATRADGFDLQWSAPSDAGPTGRAHGYLLGYRAGGAVHVESEWNQAVRETLSAPLPAAAGTPQTYALHGLAPETVYGLALRAYDAAGNLSALDGDALVGVTAAPPDTTPPAAIADLALAEAGEHWLDVNWTAPGDDGQVGQADHFLLAWTPGTTPIDSEARWSSATLETQGLPQPPVAGETVAWRLEGLLPDSSYAIAVRAVDDADLMSALSNALVARTAAAPPPPPPPDTLAPGPIEDLALVASGPDWARLAWTAPGDDDETGTASGFVLGWRAGAPLASERDWEQADTLRAGLPQPGPPGSAVEYRLTGLSATTEYRIAVRAYDERGLRSPLAAPLAVTTPAWPDTLAPARVTDLAAERAGETGVRLRWTAAGDDRFAGRAAQLIVARRADQMIESESDWEAALRETLTVATDGGRADSLLLAELDRNAAWGFALRYVDDAGGRGPISNFVTVFVPGQPADPDQTPPAAVADLRVLEMGPDWLTLAWQPAGDDGAEGEAAGYHLARLRGGRIDADNWSEALVHDIHADPGRRALCLYSLTGLVTPPGFGLAVKAYDEAGNLSPLSGALWISELATTAVSAPAPVENLAVARVGTDWVELAWQAPASGAAELPVTASEVAGGGGTITREVWEQLPHRARVETPCVAGEWCQVRIDGLLPASTYTFAVISDNGLGYYSALSNVVPVTTHPHDALAPPAPASPRITVTGTDARFEIRWDPVAETDVVGYHVYGRSGDSSLPVRLTEAPLAATAWELAQPWNGENFFVSVTAVDAAGNESAASPEVALFAREWELAGPFPHPIEEEARFLLTLPPGVPGHYTVTANIFSASGALVRRWLDRDLAAGFEQTLWWDRRGDDGARVAPGLYFLRLSAGGETFVRKIYVRG